jgi:hypothetical protein
MTVDFNKQFEYENNFYLTAPVNRFSKFATHLELFRKVSHIPGDIVECGVFKGVSLSRFVKFRSLFDNLSSKKVIAFDVFGEFPEAQYEYDKEKREKFIQEAGNKSIGKGELISIFKELDLYQNIELVEGNILDTVPEYKTENPHLKISLLHIDVDLYEPTKVVLEEFYPLMVKGGIVILDDYGAFAGANKAIDDFFKAGNIKVQKLNYSYAISFVEVI